jgi:hypothetical protein
MHPGLRRAVFDQIQADFVLFDFHLVLRIAILDWGAFLAIFVAQNGFAFASGSCPSSLGDLA